ncbi:MAG TPA: TIGR02757 family protein [Kiritimatiellia bacterium]|nr:TIGR02757 family protein [Kiritimatiellia bacterium]
MPENNNLIKIKVWLDDTYAKYHHRTWLGSDPLQFVYRYNNPLDQEIAGLIAASLAYGNVTSIHRSIENVLGRIGPNLRQFIEFSDKRAISRAMRGFRHRWTDELAITELLDGVRQVVIRHGSLGLAFTNLDNGCGTILKTLSHWVRELQPAIKRKHLRFLLSDPERNSACKRLNLYLRWMIRKDEIDPGCWGGVSPSRLMIPLDVHVFRFATACGLTRRRAADGKTVDEITSFFRRISPTDPVRYDFSLTRPGIIDGWQPRIGVKLS